MCKMVLTLNDCEEDAELKSYSEDIAKSGGRITHADRLPDKKQATIEFETDNEFIFGKAFRSTETYQYLAGCRYAS